MPENSLFQIDIPQTDVLTWLFPPGRAPSDKPIWIDSERPQERLLSPKQMLQWVKRLGCGLSNIGLKGNDVVLTLTTNHIFVPVVYLAAIGHGFIFSGCNPAYTVSEVKFQIENTSAKIIFLDPALLKVGLKAARELGFPLDRIFLFSDEECKPTDGLRDWRTMLDTEMDVDSWQWKRLCGAQSRTTTAVLNYSSGTTGLPKGVMISHLNIIANVEQSLFMRRLLHHYWSCLRNVPKTKEYDLSSLRNILCGAAPLSKELQNEVMTNVGKDLKVVQTWGMTEVTCSLLHVPGLMSDVSGSVGLIDPNCEMKLVSDEGNEVGDGERGEVHVRGPNVCLGYWRNEEATRKTFDKDGFLRTGDVAIKKSGWYWIVDRKKELIKVKGFQVAPAELEAVLLENDAVADAAVVALHVNDQERPRAYVTLKDHAKSQVKGEDIAKWVSGLVAGHKNLTGGVQIIDGEIPKSPSGKIQRVVLRDWAKRDAAAWTSSKAKL